MKKLLLAMGVLMASAASANAAVVAKYWVKDFNGGTHGLWTSKAYGDNTFSMQSGLFTIFEDDLTGDISATLAGKAKNSFDYIADINLDLDGFAETYLYKKEDGKAYDPLVHDSADIAAPDNEDVDFFTVVGGSIDIDLGGGAVDSYSAFRGGIPYTFQFGRGANAKDDSEFGGSAWLRTAPLDPEESSHWDINVAFVDVAEPSTAILFGLGIAGLGFARRRQQKA